jgi:hypothetical protein
MSGNGLLAISPANGQQISSTEPNASLFSMQKGKACFKRLLSGIRSPKEHRGQNRIHSKNQGHDPSRKVFINGIAPPRVFREAESIETLPAEVLESITHFLPTSSAALFILSSRIVMLKLGIRTFKAINEEVLPQVIIPWDPHSARDQQNLMRRWTKAQKEREIFLQLYDKDRPNSIYCHYCRAIHNPSKTFLDSARFACLAPVFSLWDTPFLPDNIDFTKLQYIMKRHRLGLETTTQLSELSKTKTKDASKGHKYTRQVSTLARIRHNKLLLRTQDWFVMASNPELQLPVWCTIELCPHWQIYPSYSWPPDKLRLMIDCKLSHGNQSGCDLCSTLIKCKRCDTEFQLDTRKFGDKRLALILTSWKDLGNCENPFDPHCNWDRHRHFGPRRYRQVASREGNRIKDEFEQFEVENGLSLDNFQAMELK